MRIGQILWGAAFVNTVDFHLPFGRPMPRRPWRGERASAPAGPIDVWTDAEHEELEFEARYIPPAETAAATGWFGATGVKEFVAAANRGEQFQVVLDRDNPGTTTHTCQAVDTIQDEREDSKAQFYRFRARVRDVTGTAFEL